jgi:hypothetical protein
MKPEHETRRKIIREWMSLPKDKRQTEEQAKLFAKKAMEDREGKADREASRHGLGRKRGAARALMEQERNGNDGAA